MCCVRELTGMTGLSKSNVVPVPDQQTALALLLELAMQRATLNHLLSTVTLLLSLWSSSRHRCDNRFTTNLYSAPLLPLLRRLQQVKPAKPLHHDLEVSPKILPWQPALFYFPCGSNMCSLQFVGQGISPNECLLRYLVLPDDDGLEVDLRQCALLIMAHLDRLAQPHLPPVNKVLVYYNVDKRNKTPKYTMSW